MRILHTSDLHLGRQFEGLSLEEDHRAILDQILQAVVEHRVDVLIIAGDVFDRASPPASAVRQFNGFLERFAAESQAALVMIAGNHDSPDRIGAMSILTDQERALIRGPITGDDRPLVLQDAAGPVAFSALPFAYEHAAREALAQDLTSPEDVLRAQMEAARQALPPGARWVVTAHAFVAGGTASESERSLTRVGGSEMVSPSVFDGCHYVALGHLHRPQSAGAAWIRYSGSPLIFGFDEEGSQKSMTLVDLSADGSVTTDPLPFTPVHQVRTVRGRHVEIEAAESSEDYVKVVLTDPVPVVDAMRRIRNTFPNACRLDYDRPRPAPERKSVDGGKGRPTDPLEVLNGFLHHVRDSEITAEERATAARILEQRQAKTNAS